MNIETGNPPEGWESEGQFRNCSSPYFYLPAANCPLPAVFLYALPVLSLSKDALYSYDSYKVARNFSIEVFTLKAFSTITMWPAPSMILKVARRRLSAR